MAIVNGLGNRTLLTHTMRAVKHMIRGGLGGPSAAAFVNSTAPTTHGGAHGVQGPGDFAVAAQGSPNMTLAVAAGFAYILSDAGAHVGTYTVYNDASTNVTITTAHATLPRIDLVCVQARDNTDDASGLNDWRLFVVAGTANGSPTVPAIPVNCLVLSQVAVGAAVTSITNTNLTDKRPRATALGGIHECTTANRPTGAARWVNKYIHDVTTGELLRWNGTEWTLPSNVSGGVYSRTLKASTQAGFALGEFVVDLAATTQPVTGRWTTIRYGLILSAVTQPAADSYIRVRLRQGTTTGGTEIERQIHPWNVGQQSFGSTDYAIQGAFAPQSFAASQQLCLTFEVGPAGSTASFTIAANSHLTIVDEGGV